MLSPICKLKNLTIGKRYGQSKCIATEELCNALEGKTLEVLAQHGTLFIVRPEDEPHAKARTVDEHMIDWLEVDVAPVDEGNFKVGDYVIIANMDPVYGSNYITINRGAIVECVSTGSNVFQIWSITKKRLPIKLSDNLPMVMLPFYNIYTLVGYIGGDKERKFVQDASCAMIEKISSEEGKEYFDEVDRKCNEKVAERQLKLDKLDKTTRSNLIDEFYNVLTERNFPCRMSAVSKIIDEWWLAKNSIIDTFSNHPLWDAENFRIVFDKDYERIYDDYSVRSFLGWVRDEIRSSEEFFSLAQNKEKTEEEEKKLLVLDVFSINVRKLCISVAKPTLSADGCDEILDLFKVVFDNRPDIPKPHEGTKTSRYINKLLGFVGDITNNENYNKEFAKFADGINPTTIRRHTIISFNPIDILLSSHGVNWTSCHDISWNDENTGCTCAGPLSYITDTCTFVMYTVNKNYEGDKYELEPRIDRCLYEWDGTKLMQGRVYPQSNDDPARKDYDTPIYKRYRAIMQEVIAECLNIPNLWEFKGLAYDYCKHGKYALNYPDWREYSRGRCTVSVPKEYAHDTVGIKKKFVIGGPAYDVVSGEIMEDAGKITYMQKDDDEEEDEYEDEGLTDDLF